MTGATIRRVVLSHVPAAIPDGALHVPADARAALTAAGWTPPGAAFRKQREGGRKSGAVRRAKAGAWSGIIRAIVDGLPRSLAAHLSSATTREEVARRLKNRESWGDLRIPGPAARPNVPSPGTIKAVLDALASERKGHLPK